VGAFEVSLPKLQTSTQRNRRVLREERTEGATRALQREERGQIEGSVEPIKRGMKKEGAVVVRLVWLPATSGQGLCGLVQGQPRNAGLIGPGVGREGATQSQARHHHHHHH
jgi:hypothetical protein